jgi:type II restriction/modification system DNA methylase subunit YeeA
MKELTPQAFAKKWAEASLSERASYQQHFLDLCAMLGQPAPAEADPSGSFYTFEKGVEKTGGSKGFADVWYRDHFAWEYKGKHKDLVAAYNQLLLYKDDLENPPLLVVSDMERYEVHTNFDRTVKKVYRFTNDELPEPENIKVLKALFEDPDSLRPARTSEGVTEEAARRLDELRRNWLNPEGATEAELKKRTLTNLYNARPTWLANAHARLDAAVYAAYGWPKDLPDEEVLKNLLALNLERAGSDR